MNESGGWEVYQLYHALKLHFTTKSYDFFKYNGKVKLTQEKFLHDRSKYFFYKLSRKYSLDEAGKFFVANFLDMKKKWVGELLTDEAEEVYQKWQKRNQSLSYIFDNDLTHLFDNCSPFLSVKSGQFPKLLQETMSGAVGLETTIIMDDLLGFMDTWEEKVDDDIIFPTWATLFKKYRPFIEYDRNKFKVIMNKHVKESLQSH
jgi:hypothetical protein